MTVIGIDHVQLAAPPGCEDEARHFFGAVLGLTEIEKPPSLAARGGAWFTAGPQQVHVGVERDFAAASRAHPALLVEPTHLDELARRLADAGAPVEWDDRLAPRRRRLYTADPWGNRLELIEPAGPQRGAWLRRGLRFLTPTNPQETLALALLCTVLLGIGAGAVKAFERITEDDPWNVRADRICFEAGDEYLNASGPPVKRLRAQVGISEEALTKLRALGGAVPIQSTLQFHTMLSDKAEVLSLLRREQQLLERGRPVAEIKARIQSTLIYVFGKDAEELGLYVCGQGTGQQ